MSFFTDRSTDTGICGTTYNKTKHDLYTYAGDPIFGTYSAPWDGTGYFATGYNSLSYVNDAPYKMDLSGLSRRKKGFGALQSHFGPNSSQPDSSCFTSPWGSPTTDEAALLENIAYWNSGYPKHVLITPKHIFCTAHFTSSSVTTISFVTKDARIITTNVTNVYDNSSGGDLKIYKITGVQGTGYTDLQHEIDAGNLTCYSDYIIPDGDAVAAFPSPTLDSPIGFRVDGNDRVLRGFLKANSSLGTVSSFEIQSDAGAISMLDLNIDAYQTKNNYYWVGDSGSPQFVYDKNLRKTIFVGAYQGFATNYVTQSSVKSAVDAILLADGYALNGISALDVDLMSFADWSNLYVNHNLSNVNLPEDLGVIKVKTESGIIENVSQLYKSNGDGTASLIWEATIEPPSDTTDYAGTDAGICCQDAPDDSGGFICSTTSESECDALNGNWLGPDATCADCGSLTDTVPCGTCELGSSVHYPVIDLQYTDCSKWKSCGNVYDMTLNTSLASYLIDPDDPLGRNRYAKIYDMPADRSFCDLPPITYVLSDVHTFAIKDRATVYITDQTLNTAELFYDVSSAIDPSEYVWPSTPNVDFNLNHRTNRTYSFSCNGPYATTPQTFCNWTVANTQTMCACQDRCDPLDTSCEFCVIQYGEVTLDTVNNDNPATCTTIVELDSGAVGGLSPVIIDTGCVATSVQCPTACYSSPKQPLPSDTDDIKPYACRDVGKVYPNFTTTRSVGTTPVDNTEYSILYESGYNFSSFGIINDSGCDLDQCTASGYTSPCRSAWSMRIFLPIYVNTPSLRYGSNGDPFDSNTDIRGKYILFNKPDLIDLGDGNTAYNEHVLLRTLYDLLRGKIKSSGTSLSFPYDFDQSSTSNNVLFWVNREIPIQISPGVASHTHQIVIEITTETSQCSTCMNTNGIGSEYDITAIRLYPITDTSGNLYGNILKPMTESLETVESIRYYYHPSSANNNEGHLYPTSEDTFISSTPYADNTTTLNTDEFTSSAITSTANLTCNEVLNILNQRKVTTTTPIFSATDCQCNEL